MIRLEIKIDSVNQAVEIVKNAIDLDYDVDFTNGYCYFDAKSLLGVLSADLSKPCSVIIHADEMDASIRGFIDSIKSTISMEERNYEKQ